MNDSSFFSIERLIEFGMGITVAQQMIESMNTSITNMHIPGAMNSLEKPQQRFFYAMLEGKQEGPFSEQELARLIAKKDVVKETYIWMPSLPKWKMAHQIPEVLKLVAMSPPSFEQNQ